MTSLASSSDMQAVASVSTFHLPVAALLLSFWST